MSKGGRNPVAMCGISLADRKWVVVLRRNKQRFPKSFSHITYGGSDAALTAAQAWRDEIVRLHPTALKREKSERIINTNKSGIPGVRRRVGPDGNRAGHIAGSRRVLTLADATSGAAQLVSREDLGASKEEKSADKNALQIKGTITLPAQADK